LLDFDNFLAVFVIVFVSFVDVGVDGVRSMMIFVLLLVRRAALWLYYRM
jgi:hypothetical protein